MLGNMKRSEKQGERVIQCFLGFRLFFFPSGVMHYLEIPLYCLEFGFCVGVLQSLSKVRPQKSDTKAAAVGGKFLLTTNISPSLKVQTEKGFCCCTPHPQAGSKRNEQFDGVWTPKHCWILVPQILMGSLQCEIPRDVLVHGKGS